MPSRWLRASIVVTCTCVSITAVLAQTQLSSRVQTLVSILQPVLPYPAADENGDLPRGGGSQTKWFVIWPDAGQPRVVVRANPLHPEIQNAGTRAMNEIQQAVIAAERKAQAAYERAIEELRRTGKATDLDGISLDDEGVAGERIDAELELTIEIEPVPAASELGTASAPVVTTSESGAPFEVRVPANVYREVTSTGTRPRFRAAEARLYFGVAATPLVSRGDGDRYTITVPSPTDGFVVVLRGNETLLNDLMARTDWRRLR